MSKKNFTRAVDSAADIFFKKSGDEKQNIKDDNVINDTNDNNVKYTHVTYDDNNVEHTHVAFDMKYTHITNKSKHYDDRGKRGERYGILLDKRLKEDLRNLANATGSRSVNDLIVTVLIDYIEAPERQKILADYDTLIQSSL